MITATSNWEQSEERSDGPTAYVSPSRLNLWLRCPLAFRLKYIDGVVTPPTPALFVGKMVHAGLEAYYRHRQLGVPIDAAELIRRLDPLWGQAVADEGAVFDSVTDEQAAKQQTADLLSVYLAQVPTDEPRPLAVEASVEAPLVDPTTGEELGIPLLGIMDLVLPAIDGPVIADFKTSSRSGEPLEIFHEVQLSSYAYLFRKSSPVSESGLEIRSLIKSKTPKAEVHHYPARNDAHFRRLFAVIRAYLDDLDRGRFVFRPGLGCGMCDYRLSHCREWTG